MEKGDLLELTEANFAREALGAAVPVLVDFTAVWCPPCRAIAPHVAGVARAYEGRVRVATCDADANPRLVAELGVRGLPTLLLFKGGQVIGQLVGAVPRSKIEALLERGLA